MIRLAALTGGTPPGQGGGFDYDQGKSNGEVQASKILYRWFESDDVVRQAEQEYSASGRGLGE